MNLTEIPEFNNILDGIENSSNILKINKIQSRISNATYSVIRYDKTKLTSDLFSTYGLFRSVILNSQNKVVSFSPPKSILAEQFIKKYPDNDNNSDVVAEEFIEGTMINVFWDPSLGINGGWEISTRNTPGATSSFFKNYKNKSFRDMFLEAISENNFNLNYLNNAYCYSFVLQHPENRIVIPFKKPQLYLIAIYSIEYVEKNIFVNFFDHNRYKEFFQLNNITIKFPEIYQFNKYSELIEKYASMNTSYDIMGVVLYNKYTRERTKIRNPVYEEVRFLRGNQPKLQYQYLFLRKEGKVKDFLKFYPENKKQFSEFRDQLHLFTNTLLNNYKSCYIKKEKPLNEFSNQYRTHMYNIHQIYLNKLREEKLFVNNTIVQKYVNDMQTSLLMYCLNFQMRKRNIDTIKSDYKLM
jgi:hypothetical protein